MVCLALKKEGYEAIMINCNPETVSTDFDIADKLYFEPVYWEHIREIIELEKPEGCHCAVGRADGIEIGRRISRERASKSSELRIVQMDIGGRQGSIFGTFERA